MAVLGPHFSRNTNGCQHQTDQNGKSTGQTWQDGQRRCMSISLWLILPQPKQCHQDRLGFPSSAWIMHQRVSIDAGASPDPPASTSTMLFSDSKTGAEGTGATTSGASGVFGGASHHGGAKFPFESIASDGGVYRSRTLHESFPG